jgi:hypothetical protein
MRVASRGHKPANSSVRRIASGASARALVSYPRFEKKPQAEKQAKNAELQGSAPSFEEDSGEIGVKREPNCVPILLGLMQKSVYLSYTREVTGRSSASC